MKLRCSKRDVILEGKDDDFCLDCWTYDLPVDEQIRFGHRGECMDKCCKEVDNMRRYLLFVGCIPSQGFESAWDHFKGSYDTLEEVEKKRKLLLYEGDYPDESWYEIVDTETEKVVLFVGITVDVWGDHAGSGVRGRADIVEELERFYDYDVPGCIVRVGKSFIVINAGSDMDGYRQEKITMGDVAEYYATEARNMLSGCRTLAGIAGDWRMVDNMAALCFQWFRYIDATKLKRALREHGLELAGRC